MVVLCAANPWDAVKMMDQHLAERLSRLAPVLYVDPPMSVAGPLRGRGGASELLGPRLRRLSPGLSRLTPLAPPRPLRPGMVRVTNAVVRRALRRATAVLGGEVRAVIATMPLLEPFGSCGEALKVYWAQDDFVAGAELFGLSASRIEAAEARLAAAAGVIVASNPVVWQAWRDRGFDPVLIPFGCDFDLFSRSDEAPPPLDIRLPAPRAGFIGHLGDRIDISLLEAVADRGHSLLLVGPRHPRSAFQRMEALLARPNVQWVGPKAFEELPSYQRAIDVGLVPYSRSQFNLGSFPLKTLEYLAAGRPVVATDLPATRWLATGLITIASDPSSFADAVGSALAEPRTPTLAARRKAFASGHSWEARASDFARVLGLAQTLPAVTARPSGGPAAPGDR